MIFIPISIKVLIFHHSRILDGNRFFSSLQMVDTSLTTKAFPSVRPAPAAGLTRGKTVDSERVKKYYTLSDQLFVFISYPKRMGYKNESLSNPPFYSDGKALVIKLTHL